MMRGHLRLSAALTKPKTCSRLYLPSKVMRIRILDAASHSLELVVAPYEILPNSGEDAILALVSRSQDAQGCIIL